MTFSNLLSSTTWYCLQLYTYATIYWKDWVIPLFYTPNDSNAETNCPFTIIKRQGLYQIYYPVIEVATFKFIQTYIEVNGKSYDIETHKFMVVGNRLFDKPFNRWLLSTEYGIELMDDDEYIVNIIDQDVNMISLSPKEYIEVNKDNYLKKSLEE
jgi:hypothetical protein